MPTPPPLPSCLGYVTHNFAFSLVLSLLDKYIYTLFAMKKSGGWDCVVSLGGFTAGPVGGGLGQW